MVGGIAGGAAADATATNPPGGSIAMRGAGADVMLWTKGADGGAPRAVQAMAG
jgi:hypothetical protein